MKTIIKLKVDNLLVKTLADHQFKFSYSNGEITLVGCTKRLIEGFIITLGYDLDAFDIKETDDELHLFEVTYGNDAWIGTSSVWARSEEEAKEVTLSELRRGIVIKNIKEV